MSAARGRYWEVRAATYLENQGLAILARGYRCRLGELDLVCRDHEHLVIVEVRSRRTNAFCSALESIGPRKLRRIVQATRHLLMRNPQWQTKPIRFDVVAFEEIEAAQAQVRWVKNAFDAS